MRTGSKGSSSAKELGLAGSGAVADRLEEAVRAFSFEFHTVQRVLKDSDNVQTTLDCEVDSYLCRVLPRVLDVPILSEEREFANSSACRFCWLVDPIDGTINAIAGSADWAVSVALIEVDTLRPVVGLVYLPVYGDMFVASLGCGARLNGTRLSAEAPRRNVIGYNTPIVSFGVPSSIREVSDKMGLALREVMRQGWVTRQTGSAAIDICRVASGMWSGFFEFGVMLWDVSAAILIAREAGCHVAVPRNDGDAGSTIWWRRPLDVLVVSLRSLTPRLESITMIKSP